MHRTTTSIAAVVSLVTWGCSADSAPFGEPRASSSHAEDASPVARGEHLVGALGCRDCHEDPTGVNGALGGRAPTPAKAGGPNLSSDAAAGLGEWTDDEIERAIREGLDDEGEALCTSMPRFAELSDDDASAIVAYLRSVPPAPRSIEASCGNGARGARPHEAPM